MRRAFLVLPILVAAAAPAVAMDDFLGDGVYAPSESDCAMLADGTGLEESSYITSQGLQAFEFACHFVSATQMTQPRPGWFVDALCEYPGETFPDVVSLFPLDETRLQVTFLTDFVRAEMQAAGGAADAVAEPAEYVLCLGLGAGAFAPPPG